MKALNILQNIFTHKTLDFVVDYEVNYDISGKIYEVKPLLYDLPESGQRLILGENSEEKKQKIEDFRKLFTIIIPLGIAYPDIFFKTELSSFQKNINQQLIENEIIQHKIHEFAENDSLACFILYANLNPETNPFRYLIDLIEKGEEANVVIHTAKLASQFPNCTVKITSLIIPILKLVHNKAKLFILLEKTTTLECRTYLLREISLHRNKGFLRHIFASLAAQEINSAIQDDLIGIYNSNNRMSPLVRFTMMKVIMQLPNEKSVNMGLKFIGDHINKSDFNTQIMELLIDAGHVESVANIMLPRLDSSNLLKSNFSLFVFSHSKAFKKFLPNTGELLKIYEEILVNVLDKPEGNLMASQRKSQMDRRLAKSIWRSMTKIIQYKFNENSADQIVGYLSSKNSEFLKGILFMIEHLSSNNLMNFEAFSAPIVNTRYLQLLDHEEPLVAKSALLVIIKFAKRKNWSCIFCKILSEINFEKNERGKFRSRTYREASMKRKQYPYQRKNRSIQKYLEDSNLEVVAKALFVLSNSSRVASQIPSINKFITTYLHDIKLKQDQKYLYTMSKIIQHHYDEKISEIILENMSNKNGNVLEGILFLINSLIYEPDIYTKPFTYLNAVSKYYGLLDLQPQHIAKLSLQLITKIGRKERDPKFISILLKRIDFNKVGNYNMLMMNAINNILPTVNYVDKVTEVYVEAFKESNSQYRILALNGLQYSNDPKLKASLAYLKNDPDEDVRNAVLLLDKEPRRM